METHHVDTASIYFDPALLAEWNGLLEVLIARRACANAGSLSYDEQLSFYDRLRPHLPDIDLKVHILNSHSYDWNTVPVHRNATDVLKTMKINEKEKGPPNKHCA